MSNPVIYVDNNTVIVNQPCSVADEQLQNRFLILIDNKFAIQQYDKTINNFVNIQNINLFNYIVDKLFKVITQQNQIQNSTQLYLLYYDAQNSRIINCRTNESFNVAEFNNLVQIYNYIVQLNQQQNQPELLQAMNMNQPELLQAMNMNQPELLQAMNMNQNQNSQILYEDEQVVISNESQIETQKQNYILHDYMLFDSNLQLITDDNIKLRYIPQIIQFIKGNKNTKAIKEQIAILINNTNKLIIHVGTQNKLTNLRTNQEIDKKSDEHKYLMSIFKNTSNSIQNSKSTESSSTQTFHNVITGIANSASNNDELFKQITLTIFLGLSSGEDIKQKIFNSKDKDEIYNILNEMIIKERNQYSHNNC